MKIKHGSRNLLEARTKRNQGQRKLKTSKKRRFNQTHQSVADPGLPRITQSIAAPIFAAQCTINGSECDLPGPLSRDDDEDSSSLVQDLDLAEHTQCSNYDMTTSGLDDAILPHDVF